MTIIGCAGGFPFGDQATSSYLIQDSEENNLLLDAGSGSLRSLEKVLDPTLIKTLIVSHDHADHTADVATFQHVAMLRQTQDQIDPLRIYSYEDSQYAKLLFENNYNKLEYYNQDTVIRQNSFQISFQRTTHPVACFAIKVEEITTHKVVVYTADSAWNNDLVEFAGGADLLIADCNYADEEGNNDLHMTSSQVARLANEANVKQLVPVHIPPMANKGKIFQEIIASLNQEITLWEPYQGAIFEVQRSKKSRSHFCDRDFFCRQNDTINCLMDILGTRLQVRICSAVELFLPLGKDEGTSWDCN